MNALRLKNSLLVLIFALTVGCKNESTSVGSGDDLAHQQEALQKAKAEFEAEKSAFEAKKKSSEKTPRSNQDSQTDASPLFATEGIQTDEPTSTAHVQDPPEATLDPLLFNTWTVTEVHCDGTNAVDEDLTITDLYNEKKMSFTFSSDRQGQLTVLSEESDGKECRLAIPFNYKLEADLDALRVQSSGEATFFPVGCNTPSKVQRGRQMAGKLYRGISPFFKYIGIQDPIRMVGAYLDPLMWALGGPTTTQITFGKEKAIPSLLGQYLPEFLYYEYVTNTTNPEEEYQELLLKIKNYYGCRKRTGANPFSPNHAEMYLRVQE